MNALTKVAILLILALLAAPALAGQGPDQEPADVLTLEKAVQLALEHSLQIESSLYEKDAAKWGKWEAVSGWLPKVRFDSSVTRMDEDTVDRLNIYTDSTRELADLYGFDPDEIEPAAYDNTYSSSLSVIQPVTNGGAEVGAILAARALHAQKRHAYADARSKTVLDTKTAYFNVLKARALLEVANESHRLAQETLRMFDARYSVGEVSRADVLRWEAQAAKAENALLEAGNGLEVAKITLANVLGIDLDVRYELERLPEKADLDSFREVLRDADVDRELNAAQMAERFQEHPGIQRMESVVDAAGGNRVIAWSSVLPRLNLAYTYSWETDDDPDLDGQESWTLSLALQMPLFQSLTGAFKIAQARKNYKLAKVGLKSYERGFMQQAYAYRLGLRSAYLRILAAEKERKFADENLKITMSKHELGMASNLQLVDAQLAFNQARSSYIDAMSDFYVAAANWEYLTIGEKNKE